MNQPINTDELEELIDQLYPPVRGKGAPESIRRKARAALESIIKTKELEARIDELERLLRRRDCQRPRCEVEHTYLTKLHTEKRLASLRKELKDGV